MLYVLSYYLLWPICKLLFKVQIKGKNNLPKERAAIVAANHASYLDPILLALAFYPRKIKFMAKEELFRIPLFNLLITSLGAFPVKREKAHLTALKTAEQILNSQGLLGIFPEGTRYKNKLGPAQLGAALIALKTKAPIIPVAIKGSGLVWPEGSWRFYLPKITVIIGEPITVVNNSSTPWRRQAEQLTAELMEKIKQLLNNDKEDKQLELRGKTYEN